MRWLKVTAVALLLLTAANIFVGIRLNRLYSDTYYLSDEAVGTAVKLLEKDGLKAAPDAVPRRKADFPIYECAFFADSEAYYRSAAETVMTDGGSSDENGLTLYLAANGIRISCAGGAAVMEFYDEGISSFMYCADGSCEDEEEIAGSAAQWGNVADSGDREIKNGIKIFGRTLGFGPEKNDLAFVCTGAYMSDDKNDILLELSQTADGLEIENMSGVCLIRGGKIVYIRGNFLFFSETAAYSCNNYDCINVLFDERDALRGEDAEIVSVSAAYTAMHHSGTDKLYIVPAWKITYSDGTTHVRDMLDGSPAE